VVVLGTGPCKSREEALEKLEVDMDMDKVLCGSEEDVLERLNEMLETEVQSETMGRMGRILAKVRDDKGKELWFNVG
jgi:hypothetical protein